MPILPQGALACLKRALQIWKMVSKGKEMQIWTLSDEEHAQNVPRQDDESVAALVALCNKGTGLRAKAKRQFWLINRKSKGGTLPMFKGAIAIMLLHTTVEGYHNLPSCEQQMHMHSIHQRLIDMDVFHTAQLAKKHDILAHDVVGAFQQLLLLRPARGEYG